MSLDNTTVVPSVGGGGFYDFPIEQSLRFNDDDNPYLTRTPSSASNRRTWTWSAWVKRGNLSNFQSLFSATTEVASGNSHSYISLYNDYVFIENYIYPSGTNWSLSTNALLRDPSAWYHIVLTVDTTQATASDRIKLYVNGEQVTSFASSTYPSQNFEGHVNSTYKHKLGNSFIPASSRAFDGHMAEVNFIDGTALDASSFGETKSGVWIPKSYSGSYGTNGFYLDFGNSGSIGADVSGNGNNFTANNLAASDVVLDSPTNNFATLNPLSRNGTNASADFNEGNLKVYKSTGDYYQAMSTFPITSGKWYAELRVVSTQAKVQFGVLMDDKSSNAATNRAIGQDGYSYYYTGQKLAFGTASSYGASFTAGDILGIAVDADNGSITFYKNGASQGTAFSSLSYNNYLIGCSLEDGGTAMANFGQDSSFAGAVTAQGNQDDNGYGDFYYSPPSGFFALCTANLEVPAAIDPGESASPQDYFNTVLYTGDGTDNRSITGFGFAPDFIWGKARSNSNSHRLADKVRGATKIIMSDVADAEYTGNAVVSFDADGYTTSRTSGNLNDNTWTYVAWGWKADNTSGSTNTDGSVTSTVSANQDLGFSICTFTASTSAYTFGHGLSQAPEFIMLKNRERASSWSVYHEGIGETKVMRLDTTAAATTSGSWNNTAPSSTIVYNGDLYNENCVAYCFHSVKGYSKFGTYTGNGNADGTFVYLGFTPKFVIIKCSTLSEGWIMYDTERTPSNVITTPITAEEATGDVSNAAYAIDLLSNGFKARYNWNGINGSGQTYHYMAFAENPFKYATAR